jgi:hypothetical protein
VPSVDIEETAMAIREHLPQTLDPMPVRRAGEVCLAAGLLAAASGVFLAVVPAQVGTDRYSYPLAAGGFVAMQVLLCVLQLGLVAGLLGLRRSGAAGSGRLGAWGLAAAITGMGLLALVNLVAISAVHASTSDPRSGILDALYGVTSILSGVGLVLAGVAIRRTGRWTGWRSWLVLTLGVYILVPLTAAVAAPFPVGDLALTVLMLLFAALGGVLASSTREPS